MTKQFTTKIKSLIDEVRSKGEADKVGGLLRHLERALQASKDLEPKGGK